jgi:hypothetical protein
MHKSISWVAAVLCGVTFSVAGAQAGSPSQTGNAPPQAMGVQVLSASQMAKADTDIVASLRNELTWAAELNGYYLNAGTWIQNQVVCPEAPGHILMHYLKLNRDETVSMFTAVMRRDPAGATHTQVRILPVLYHGTPATLAFGSTPAQREFINEVVVSAKSLASAPASSSGWASLAFCYAALAGAEPASPGVTARDEIAPILHVSPEGKPLDMRFSVAGPGRLLQDWKIEFDRNAQVKSIAFSTRPSATPQPVPSIAAHAPVSAASTAAPAEPVAPTAPTATPAPVPSAAAAAPPAPSAPPAPPTPVAPATPAAPTTPPATPAPVPAAATAVPPAPSAPPASPPPVARATPAVPPATPAPVPSAATAAPPTPVAPAAPVTPPAAPTPVAPGQKLKWRPVPQGPKLKEHPVPPAH